VGIEAIDAKRRVGGSGVVFSSPSIVEDAVYVGGGNQWVYAFG